MVVFVEVFYTFHADVNQSYMNTSQTLNNPVLSCSIPDMRRPDFVITGWVVYMYVIAAKVWTPPIDKQLKFKTEIQKHLFWSYKHMRNTYMQGKNMTTGIMKHSLLVPWVLKS